MKQTLLSAALLLGFTSINAQSLAVDKIHWGKDDGISRKANIKEVLVFDGKSISELHEMLKSWYLEEFFEKRLGYSYRFHGVSGGFMWQSDTKKPFIILEPERIHPKNIRCYNCMLAWKKSDLNKRHHGFYQMDIRIKHGKVLLVTSDFYSELNDSYLSDWIVKKGELVDRPDARIEALEIEFQKLKENLLVYEKNFGKDKQIEQKTEKVDSDNW
jgi:hypothetical protein